MKITATVVKDATIMPDIYYIWDSEIKGFGLKVIPNGMKKFLIKYRVGGGGRRANQKWFILGESATMKVDVARKPASEMLVKVSNGGDPQDEKQARRDAYSQRLWSQNESLCRPYSIPLPRRDFPISSFQKLAF